MNKKIKLLAFFSVLVFSALACVLPGQTSAEQKTLNDLDIKNSVDATLAAVIPDNPDAQEPIVPEEGEDENPSDVVTATFTPVPSLTPTNTAEPTATTSPTPPAGDPKLSLGDPDYKDTFSANNYWLIEDGPSTKTEIKDEKFLYTMYNASLYSDQWTFSWKEIKDFYLEVTATTPSDCSGKDRYGVIFRSPSFNAGYIYYLSCDGSYLLNMWDGATMTALVEWTESSEIEQGSDKSNRLGIMTHDNDISLYVNGKLLVTVEDNSYMNKGLFGFAIAADNTPGFAIAFDDLMYWE